MAADPKPKGGPVDTEPVDTEMVACDVCLKEIPLSEARIDEAEDYVRHFCGLDCYAKWKQQTPRDKDNASGKT